MRRLNIFLACLTAALALFAGVGSAGAYFTSYAQAQGGHPIVLGARTEIHERVSDWTKHVTISSQEDSAPVFVRARAFAGNAYSLRYSGDGWSAGDDGFYYYDQALPGGGVTPELLIKIENIPPEEAGDAALNVVVVYETAPAQYRPDGTAYADWAAALSDGEEGGQR